MRRCSNSEILADTALGTIISLGQGFFRTSTRILESLEYSVFTGANADQPVLGQQNRAHLGQDGVNVNAKRVVLYNQVADTGAPVELFNFAGQGNAYPNYPIAAVVVHNYTDSEGMRIDQVGSGALLRLRNAQNQVHRPGLAIGTGEYLVFDEENYNGGTPVSAKLFSAYKNGSELVFNATGNIPAGVAQGLSWNFINNRAASSANFPFVFSTTFAHQYLWKLRSAGNDVCYWENTFNEARLYSSSPQSSGLRLGAVVGPVILAPSSGNDVKFFRGGALVVAQPVLSGSTASRPATQLTTGLGYYDTTLGKPVYWNGSAWMDAVGAAA